MKASDLENARRIDESRRENVAMRDRLAANDRLILTIGTAGNEQAIVLTPAYLDGIRADLIAAFNTRIGQNEAALAALGVEP